MATTRYNSNDIRRQVGSPRPKGRENKDTLCRNVLIYGHCRYEGQGCTFNHDQSKNNSSQTDLSGKKTLNVESPSFTPSNLQQTGKKSTLSTQAASAAPFTPRGPNATPSLQHNVEAPVFNPATVREFTPQNYDLSKSVSPSSSGHDNGYPVDQFSMGHLAQALPATSQFNPYAGDHSTLANATASYFPSHGAYATPLQPPQYHLYAPIGPYREDLLPYQRAAHDFFLSERLREDLQKKAHATLQVMPNTTLPQLDRFHTLFPLDTNNRKNTTVFGYPSWVFRATSSKNGKFYCLRRLEGYRLTNENAIHAAKEWKKVMNANVVTFHEAFTTRQFGDSSLIFCHDYHPLSKTLAEQYFPAMPANRYRGLPSIPENILWSYICQIANALRAIHSLKLAARCLELSKIIITDKNRIRLAACSILDVVQYNPKPRPIAELQQEDMLQFGKLVLSLATSTLPVHLTNIQAVVDSLSPKYSAGLKEAVAWLVSSPQPGEAPKTIENFLGGIATHMAQYTDMALLSVDTLSSEFQREVENGRIARLLMKINTVLERGEFAGDPNWSENGERYLLKLFRDYVFHQVDQDGNPRLELGHMLMCLNKLDAAADERILLTSRDEQNVFVVTYREVKQVFERAFNELVKQSKPAAT
ncbi:hypothetical protein VTK73DRAFT_1196 [Phialemonium thermophilum]|uniref:PAN2-PAN3 deadenylation complex subunit PAN3 n=1 Tax=Phialemonium thermophilum TaxID=223376 RepID=A0ABR3XBQ9_9PEZI